MLLGASCQRSCLFMHRVMRGLFLGNFNLFCVPLILITLVTIQKERLTNGVTGQQTANITLTTTNLSEARNSLVAASSGDLVFFGGGLNGTNTTSARVDIYNVTSGIWTTATLSIPRTGLAAASSGNLVLFGGGYGGDSELYNQVDIYNISDGSCSTATLSQARHSLAATSVGDIVLFGGGYNGTVSYNLVDIYNVTSNKWTTATLSQARAWLAATSVANRYALFAGGTNGSDVSNVDIYDLWNGMWLTATLSQARSILAATSLGNLSFFGGGQINGSQASNVVDIFNSTTNTWSNATLSQARYALAAAAIGDIVAFGGGTPDGSTPSSLVDMYNTTSNMWFSIYMSQSRYYLAATSSTYKIFFGGGQTSGTTPLNTVDILDVYANLTSLSTPPPTSQSPLTLTPSSASLSTAFSTLSGSTQNNSPSQRSKVNSSLSLDATIGIIIGSVAVAVACGILIFLILFLKRRKQKKKHKESERSELSNTVTSVPKATEDKQPEHYTAITREKPKSTQQPLMDENEKMKSESITIYQIIVDRTKKYQIPFNDIEVVKELGKGSYGKVCLGRWNDNPVALKFCKEKEGLDDFLKEAGLMVELPPHPNIVQVFGISIDGPQPILVLEYCAGGSLDKFLFDSGQPLSEEYKIQLVKGIARGMLHLHRHNIIHRDLAARNILLTATKEPKISDFGMSRVLQREDEEGQTKTNIGPIRWMAPESISKRKYSKKSDVWSFGIVVWEIVAQREPHSDIEIVDAAVQIRDKGLVPKIPENCPPLLREIMLLCWKQQPEERPTFQEICRLLGK
jgi:predicted Ser/Thr protein kinase/uncharacterized protein YkvS